MSRAIVCACAGIICLVVALMRAPAPLRPALWVFNGLYVLTTALGATILTLPQVREFWSLMFPSMDERWLVPGGEWGYWYLVWGPMLIVNVAAIKLYPRLRAPAVVAARWLSVRVDVLPAAIAGFAMCGYGFINLGAHGDLSVSLLNSELAGLYNVNILLRTSMFQTLGTLHFAFIYMGIPAIAIVAFYNTVRRRSFAWGVLFTSLSVALVLLYLSTLTKSNVLIFGMELTIAAYVLGIVGRRGLVIAALAGCGLLTVLSALLSGGSPLEFAGSAYNVIFREASGIPFYLGVFPRQIPFVGIDLGLGALGIGPKVPVNMMIYNYMFPHDIWVQGAAPAAAQFDGYAQAGYPWALVTMVAMGAWAAFTGQLNRIAHNEVVFSAFIGAVTTTYYLTQGDLVGALNVSYGYKWWLAGLLLLLIVQRVLELAVVPRIDAQETVADSESRN
ncbi:MAG: hypothetical protein ACREVV_14715 [Steroidobacteraceae bacterium]